MAVMAQAQLLYKGHLDVLRGHIDGVESRLAAVNAQADQELFIEHNIRPFTKPGDWSFEPAAVHYDTVGCLPFLHCYPVVHVARRCDAGRHGRRAAGAESLPPEQAVEV